MSDRPRGNRRNFSASIKATRNLKIRHKHFFKLLILFALILLKINHSQCQRATEYPDYFFKNRTSTKLYKRNTLRTLRFFGCQF